MKAIAVQQPWATLICSGIKDVENRTWKPTHMGRVLIVASSKKVPKSLRDQLPPTWFAEIFNNEVAGNIPYMEDMLTSAVIGYVDIVEVSEDNDFFWGGGPGCYKWLLENAYIFDEPQMVGIKAKLNFFDIPEIDENNLPPAHKVQLRVPSIHGTEIVVPVRSDDYDASGIEDDCPYTLEMTDQLMALCDENDLTKIKSVRFEKVNGSFERYEIQRLEVCYVPCVDNHDIPAMYEGMELLCLEIVTGKQI